MTEQPVLQNIKRWLWQEQEYSITDADAFAKLYELHHLTVFRYVYGLSGGPQQDAEDITAETFIRAWTTRHRFTGSKQAALGWILRIARNLIIDSSRRRRVRPEEESIDLESLLDTKSLPEIDIITREQAMVLWKTLSTLPEDLREMLVLRYMLGWQVKQIALHLEITENNVSVSMRRALNRLQQGWPQS